MPLFLRHHTNSGEGWQPAAPAGALKIALINNMPDPALEATERQFGGSLAAASSDLAVELAIFCLPSLPRGLAGAIHCQRRYGDYGRLFGEQWDGVIITGNEPRLPDLADEPYWADLVTLFDWAAESTQAVLLSCLSSHAWLQHRDGIRRRRLAAKHCGIFPHDLAAAQDDDFGRDLPARVFLPHSRWNDLDSRELEQAGYRQLYASPAAGIGVFLQRAEAFTLLCQGHPEYDDVSLAKEYRRDVGRYLRRESEIYPTVPAGLFSPATLARLDEFRVEALADRNEARLALLPPLLPELDAGVDWRPHTVQLFARWLQVARYGAKRTVVPLPASAPQPVAGWSVR
jgi:homoserine O-succinyltransferase/O-acetyltransferase